MALLDGLLALYKFNKDAGTYNGTADEVVDSSGNGNHGVAVDGADTVTSGIIDQSFINDGGSKRVDIPSLTWSSEMFCSFKSKVVNKATGQYFTMNWHSTGFTMRCVIVNTSVLEVYLYRASDGAEIKASCTNTLVSNVPFTLQFGFNSTDSKLYVYKDNAQIGVSGAVAGNIKVSNGNIRVGAYFTTAYALTLNGQMDELAFFDEFKDTTDRQTMVDGEIIVDETPPADPTNFTAVRDSSSQTTLTWDNPTDSDFDKVMVRYSTVAFPTSITDGSLLYEGALETKVHTGQSAVDYYYTIFSADAIPNWSSGANTTSIADVTPPAEVTSLVATRTTFAITDLSWTNPTDSDFANVMIRRSTTAYPTGIADGDHVYTGALEEYEDSGQTNIDYYYTVFTSDAVPNWSDGSNVLSEKDSSAPVIGDIVSFNIIDIFSIITKVTPPTEGDFNHLVVRSNVDGGDYYYLTDVDGIATWALSGTNVKFGPDDCINYSMYREGLPEGGIFVLEAMGYDDAGNTDGWVVGDETEVSNDKVVVGGNNYFAKDAKKEITVKRFVRSN